MTADISKCELQSIQALHTRISVNNSPFKQAWIPDITLYVPTFLLLICEVLFIQPTQWLTSHPSSACPWPTAVPVTSQYIIQVASLFSSMSIFVSVLHTNVKTLQNINKNLLLRLFSIVLLPTELRPQIYIQADFTI